MESDFFQLTAEHNGFSVATTLHGSGGNVSRHFNLISMATRFDLGQGVELIRIPAIYGSDTNPRWYVTRGCDYILHRQRGWVRYDSVSDGDFLFPDADSAFAFFTTGDAGIHGRFWDEAESRERGDTVSDTWP